MFFLRYFNYSIWKFMKYYGAVRTTQCIVNKVKLMTLMQINY